jgi:hypothetical protein
MLGMRNTPRGPELRIAKTLNRIYPRYEEGIASVYRAALSTALPVHDQSKLFDMSSEPYFVDAIHINERGNRLVAERIYEIVSPGLPGFGEHQ